MTGLCIGLMVGFWCGCWAVYFAHDWIWRD